MIKLKRAQYRYNGEDRMDITAKSAEGYAKWFAPLWEMVVAHKSGAVDDETYARRYIRILNRVPHLSHKLEEYGESGEITFVCFCPDGKFCHTHILINYLVDRFPDKFSK